MNNWKCSCGVINFSTDELCKKCQSPKPSLNSSEAYSQPQYEPYTVPAQSIVKASGVTGSQGYILIVLLTIGISLLAYNTFKSPPRYTYKVVNMLSESNERTGTGALKYASITMNEQELVAIGYDGWELVGNFLEMETAFPNFGNSDYVTGLQPNIRPQRVVLLFRKAIK